MWLNIVLSLIFNNFNDNITLDKIMIKEVFVSYFENYKRLIVMLYVILLLNHYLLVTVWNHIHELILERTFNRITIILYLGIWIAFKKKKKSST